MLGFRCFPTTMMLVGLTVNISGLFVHSTAFAQNGSFGIFSGTSLPSYRYDDYDIERQQERVERAQRKIDGSRRQVDESNRNLAGARGREHEIQQSLQQQSRAIENNRRKIEELSRAVRENETLVEKKRGEASDLQGAVAALENKALPLMSELEELKKKKEQAATDAEKQELQKAIDQKSAVFQPIYDEWQTKKRALEQVNNQLQKTIGDLGNARNQLQQAQSEAPALQNRLVELQRNLEGASRERQQREREMERAQSELNSDQRELQSQIQSLDAIRNNINIAQNILRSEGQQQGANDGRREGKELGRERGQTKGDTEGRDDGDRRGTSDGKNRDFASGRLEGRTQASREATAKSKADGQIQGANDGLRDGRLAGLKAAYDLGMKEGLAHGTQTGDDREAYGQGRLEGEKAGLAKAVEDARPQEAIGYKNKEAEYLSAPLKSVVIGDAALLAKWKGLQGRFSEEGDDRYYRPQPGVLPHPRLERFYLEAYDGEYRSELGLMYHTTYQNEYSQAFEAASKRAYEQAFNKTFPESRNDGRQKGYKETYQVVYDRNYQEVYAQIYKENFDIKFNEFKLDVGERARGFKEGNRISSRQKGYDEGFKAIYSANIDSEKKKAYEIGVNKAAQLYNNNPVIKLTGIELREKDADGVFRPGEPLQVVLKLKNYGMQSKNDLSSELTEAQGSITVQQSKLVSASVPAQSDATIIMPAQAIVTSDAADGSALQVTVRAATGASVFGSQKFTLSAQYPSKVSIVGFDGILVPGVETPVQVVVQNRSQSVQNLRISVFRDASKVDVDSEQLGVNNLAAGQSRQLILKLKGRMEAKFEESSLELQTRQADLKFAVDSKSALTIIRKHSPRTESKGLILSSNLAQGSGKKLFETVDLDTWDLRVDGPLNNKAALEPYKNKVLHILADDYAQMDASSAQVVRQFAAANGSTILWGSRLDYSEVAKSLLASFGVRVVNAIQYNGVLRGQQKLKGVSLPVRGIVSLVEANSSKSAVALNSEYGAIATILFGLGTEESVGQTMVAGVNLNEVDGADIKKMMIAFDQVRLPFAKKLESARANPKANMHLVVEDIRNEMLGAELLATGEFYKKNDESNKIARAAKMYIGDDGRKSAQAKELSSYYPQIAGMLLQMPKENWRAELVLNKRYGSFFTARNLKDLYCDEHHGEAICTR